MIGIMIAMLGMLARIGGTWRYIPLLSIYDFFCCICGVKLFVSVYQVTDITSSRA